MPVQLGLGWKTEPIDGSLRPGRCRIRKPHIIPEALRMAFLDVWTTWKSKAVRSLEKRGVGGTIQHTAVLAKRLLMERCIRFHPWNAWNPWYRFLNQRFDRRFGVDTADHLRLPELHSDPRFQYSEEYDPTPRFIFFRLLRQIHVDYSNFVFIDIGCGKGKVLLLASELPFQQIIGIELSSQLIQVAEDNLRNYLSRTGKRNDIVQLACIDAAEFQIPHEPAICYFYNPFGAEVMRKVLENIGLSLAAAPREIYVMYLYPVHHGLLDESGFLTPVTKTFWYAIYKASALS